MPHIPHDAVLGGTHLGMKGDGELDHPEAGAQMTTDLGHGGNDLLPDLRRQTAELDGIQPAHIARQVELIEKSHGPGVYSSPARRALCTAPSTPFTKDAASSEANRLA